ncbi:MAG: hypothetical protein RLZZ528_1885 [Pseudomonadota bacterium]
MFTLGAIGFVSPWLLAGLVALPVLWLLLRAIPPAPVRRRFPGVALLLGLKDDQTEADKTPWWLLLLRCLAVTAAIIGFAGPVLNPVEQTSGTGPLLVVADASWADAGDWERRRERISRAVTEAGRAGRSVAVVALGDLPTGGPVFRTADQVQASVAALVPSAWEPGAEAMGGLAAALPEGGFDTLWISDGIARPGRDRLAQALAAKGQVTVVESPREVVALRAPRFENGVVSVTALRNRDHAALEAEVAVQGLDPAGVTRELARAPLVFAAGERQATVDFDLPPELRNRITRFEIAGRRSAGAVALADDSLRRREVALIDGEATREGLQLLSPTHYLRQALQPTADLIDGTLSDILLADPDVVILADVAKVNETDALLDWVDEGGLLLRFAGPRLAAADVGREIEDPLLPVRLRAGGRNVGGAMSWGEPKAIAPFVEGSPFFGLTVPADVEVSAQVIAEPDPELSSRTIAALADGTPLVTWREIGEGRVVLFHVAANAEWSSLPLSGLFVEMLERLAIAAGGDLPGRGDLTGTTWVADEVLDAFGALRAAGQMPGVAGERLAGELTGPDLPPGLYADDRRRIALNAIAADRELLPAEWPAGTVVEGLATEGETPMTGWFLAAAFGLLLSDVLASLLVAGRPTGLRGGGAVAGMVAAVLLSVGDARAQGQSDETALIATAGNVVLAYVRTGDTRVDRTAAAGMLGLSEILFARTSVEPSEPVGVDLETDELSILTFLYWPVTPDQKAPSPQAYAKLNRYLRSGGMILFDTLDGDVAGFGAATPNGRRLQALAAPLDIPPLEPMPEDHVLTRAFYLLQDFPGRHTGRAVWVEAAPPDAELAEGMPFRNLNDGVTPVIIGGNDWASAWAIDQRGLPMYPIGRGIGGERQREIAYRFGVNIIMHVLTGNYKSDQVHVPALLERLGQ